MDSAHLLARLVTGGILWPLFCAGCLYVMALLDDSSPDSGVGVVAGFFLVASAAVEIALFVYALIVLTLYAL